MPAFPLERVKFKHSCSVGADIEQPCLGIVDNIHDLLVAQFIGKRWFCEIAILPFPQTISVSAHPESPLAVDGCTGDDINTLCRFHLPCISQIGVRATEHAASVCSNPIDTIVISTERSDAGGILDTSFSYYGIINERRVIVRYHQQAFHKEGCDNIASAILFQTMHLASIGIKVGLTKLPMLQ